MLEDTCAYMSRQVLDKQVLLQHVFAQEICGFISNWLGTSRKHAKISVRKFIDACWQQNIERQEKEKETGEEEERRKKD